jgi:hypothetical protein
MHCKPLTMKELCQEMSEVMDTVMKTVNYIKTRPLKSRLFAELYKEMGHCISHSCFTVIFVGCKMKCCASCLQFARSSIVFTRKI